MIGPLSPASGMALVIAWCALMLAAIGGVEVVKPIGMLAVAFYLIVQAPQLVRFAWGHLTFGALVTLTALFVLEHPGQILADGFWRSVFIVVLFASLGIMRVAAQTSAMVLETGAMLVRQPPGRRYFAIVGGSTLFGAILNFGTIALFGGMIRDAVSDKPGGIVIDKARERRMMLALLRGFALTMFWCPLTVAFAIASTTIGGAQWPLMVLFGAILAVIVTTGGWLIDSPASRRASGPQETVPFSWKALTPLIGLLIFLSTAAAFVERFTYGQLIHGVILLVPIIGIAWILRDVGQTGLRRVGQYISEQVPQARNELTVLANAAYAGTLIGALLPQVFIDAVIGPQALPAVFVPALFMLLVVLFGLLGANPLITVAVLATVMVDPGRYGVSPTLVASALTIGWGLAIASSPATAATMYIGRLTGYGASTVGPRWNGAYTAFAVLVVAAALTAMAAIVGS